MIKNSYLVLAFVLGFLFTSCNENTTTEEKANQNKSNENTETCIYSYNPDNSKVEFTAYKFLNKTGVGGEFINFEVAHAETGKSVEEVIKNLSFEIPVSGLNTKDNGRDEKIIKFFFGAINVKTISGKVIDLENNVANIEITLNEITKKVEGNYSIDGEVFNFNAEIDVLDWDASAGIEALNEECLDLHIDYANGDTESKLWSEVSIAFSTELDKSCD